MASLTAPAPLTRVAPMCEMRACPNRADYFWHWQVAPLVSWMPICAEHADSQAEDLGALPVSAVAETSAAMYRSSDHPQRVTADG